MMSFKSVTKALCMTLPILLGFDLSSSIAGDLGFRFKWDSETHKGECVDDNGLRGYNPAFIGPCGDLRGRTVGNLDLDGAVLDGAILDGLDLRYKKINGALLRGVRAHGTDFSKAQMNGARFVGADVSGANFDRSELNGANFNYADLTGSQFRFVELNGVQFRNALLQGTVIKSSLKSANLKGAKFSNGTKLPFKRKAARKRGMVSVYPHAMDKMGSKRLPASIRNMN